MGFHELAGGTEVLDHFDRTMRHRFLPSGRVQYFPMCDVGDDGVVTSLLSGKRTVVEARRFVDGTYSRMRIPSTTSPPTPSLRAWLVRRRTPYPVSLQRTTTMSS